MQDITFIILTYNEENNITDCINSIKSIAKRIVVVDSYSTDNTVKIVKEMGAELYQNKWINYSKQYQFGIDASKPTTKWIFRLDADERLTPEAVQELNELLAAHDSDDVNGIIVRFEVSFLGRKLKHGGIYPFRKLLIYRNGFGQIEDKEMDEHILLSSGKTICMKSDCQHLDIKDIYSWIDKHNKYSNREVIDCVHHSSANTKNMDRIASRRAKQKYGFYYKLPLFLRAKLYYLYRLVIKGAWLDGREGKIFAFLQAYWYRYLVDAKLFEYYKKRVASQINYMGLITLVEEL